MYIGILAGLTTSFFADWRVSVLVGAIVVLFVSLLLPFVFYLVFLPYARIKRTLPQPFLFDEPVQFTARSGRVSGFFILTEKSMIFLSRECKNQVTELTRDKVKKTVVLKEPGAMDVYLNDTQFIRMFCIVREELVELLRKNGWNVTE